MNLSQLLQTTNDKRLEQYESHLLRQSTLVKLELRADHNYGTTRVINSLAQQIHTESASLPLQHIGERF